MSGPATWTCRKCNIPLKHGRIEEYGAPPPDGSWKYGAWTNERHKRWCSCRVCEDERHRRNLYIGEIKILHWIAIKVCRDCVCKKKACESLRYKETEYCRKCQRCPWHPDLNISKSPCKRCAKQWKKCKGKEWRPWNHLIYPSHVRAQIETVLIIARAATANGEEWAYNDHTGGLSELPNEILQKIFDYIVAQEEPS